MDNKPTSDTGEFESLKRILEQCQATDPRGPEAATMMLTNCLAKLKHFGPDEGDGELLMPPKGCAGELRQLRADQRQAIESILAGATYEKAARDAGVDRRTLYRWMNKDSAFGHALENQRRRVVRGAGDRLVSGGQAAAATLCEAAAKGNVGAAANVLKLIIQFQQAMPQTANIGELIPAGMPRQIQMRLREMLLSLTAEGEAGNEGIREEKAVLALGDDRQTAALPGAGEQAVGGLGEKSEVPPSNAER